MMPCHRVREAVYEVRHFTLVALLHGRRILLARHALTLYHILQDLSRSNIPPHGKIKGNISTGPCADAAAILAVVSANVFSFRNLSGVLSFSSTYS